MEMGGLETIAVDQLATTSGLIQPNLRMPKGTRVMEPMQFI